MKKNIFVLSSVLLLVLAFWSCSNDDETVLSSDCYISSFSLGTVTRSAVTTSSTGEDSTYYVSYDASGYNMIIDQLGGTIENKDSLPVNSSVDAVLVTIATSGVVVYRQADEDVENWMAYSSKDSINLTRPLIFRVISADGTAWRDYKVSVNIHQVDGDEFVWNKLTEACPWSSSDDLKALVWDGKAWLFAQDGTGMHVFCSDIDGGVTWTELVPTGCDMANISTLTLFKDVLYMSCTDGSLICSDDARIWTPVMADKDNLQLFISDETSLYALDGLSILRSPDGLHWTEESLDDDASFLPYQDIAAASYMQSNGLHKIILMGNRSLADYPSDGRAVVWGRGTMSGSVLPTQWMYYNWASDNYYACPQLASLELVHYGDVLIAMGRAGEDDTSNGLLEDAYVSEDNGITWKTSQVYVLPESVRHVPEVFAVTSDGQNRLWLIVGGEVWRGYLNKLNF